MGIDWGRWETVTVDLSVGQRLEYGFCRDTEVGWRFCFWNRLNRKPSGDWAPVESWDALYGEQAPPDLPDAVLLALESKLSAPRSGQLLAGAALAVSAASIVGFGFGFWAYML